MNMKKAFFTLILLIIFANSQHVQAKKVFVDVIEDFNSLNPKTNYSIKVSEDIAFKDKQKIEKGSVISGNVVKVVHARRLKRNAYIVFRGTEFTIPSKDNKVVHLKHPLKFKIRQSRDRDKVEMTANTGIIAASYFVPVLNIIVPALQFVVGAATPKNDEHPLHSGCRSLVESWPACYCLKGKELQLSSGSSVKVILKNKKLGKSAEAAFIGK